MLVQVLHETDTKTGLDTQEICQGGNSGILRLTVFPQNSGPSWPQNVTLFGNNVVADVIR